MPENAPIHSQVSGPDILRIAETEPERLFSGTAEAARSEYRQLAALWHPDRHAGANEADAARVFQHIASLYRAAQARLASGRWERPGLLQLQTSDGQTLELAYKKRHPFELGEMLISPTMVAYVLEAGQEDLGSAAQASMAKFRYAHAQMQQELEPQLPQLAGYFACRDATVLVLRKQPDQILLRDLLAHCGGRLPAVHVAWILSSLYSLACYFSYARLTHNAIGIDSVFISPAAHRCSLLGGWFYARPAGSRLKAAPQRAVQVAPPDILHSKIASPRLDLELIRSLGRELLGDESGNRLLLDKAVPKPLAQWLRLASSGSALEDYRLWQSNVLPESFGRRRFIQLEVSADQIYP